MNNIALLLQLAIAGLTHAIEIQAAIGKAVAEGRDLTPGELAEFRTRAAAAVDAFDAAVKGMTP